MRWCVALALSACGDSAANVSVVPIEPIGPSEPYGVIAQAEVPTLAPRGSIIAALHFDGLEPSDVEGFIATLDDGWVVLAQAQADAVTRDGVVLVPAAAGPRTVAIAVGLDGEVRAVRALPTLDNDNTVGGIVACGDHAWSFARGRSQSWVHRLSADLGDMTPTRFAVAGRPLTDNPAQATVVALTCVGARVLATVQTNTGMTIAGQGEVVVVPIEGPGTFVIAVQPTEVVTREDQRVVALGPSDQGFLLAQMPAAQDPHARVTFERRAAGVEPLSLGSVAAAVQPTVLAEVGDTFVYCAVRYRSSGLGYDPASLDPTTDTYCVAAADGDPHVIFEMPEYARAVALTDTSLWVAAPIRFASPRLGDPAGDFIAFLVGVDPHTGAITSRGYWKEHGRYAQPYGLFAADTEVPCSGSGRAVQVRVMDDVGNDDSRVVFVAEGAQQTGCSARVMRWQGGPDDGSLGPYLSPPSRGPCGEQRYLVDLPHGGALTIDGPSEPATVASASAGFDLVVFAPSECAITRQ